jgi:hypothetical protein
MGEIFGVFFPIKGQEANILGSVGHKVSFATIKLCHWSIKATTGKKKHECVWLCLNETFMVTEILIYVIYTHCKSFLFIIFLHLKMIKPILGSLSHA